MLWVHQVKIYITIWVSKVKGQHKRAMMKMNVLNIKMWIKLMTKHWPCLFLTTISSSFCVFFSSLNGYGCGKSRFKKTFALEKQKENVLGLKLFKSLSVYSLTCRIIVVSML